MGTLHELAEHRAVRRQAAAPLLPAGDPDAPEWRLLAGRADSVLAKLDATIGASSRRRPGVIALRAEVAGLQYALMCAAQRRMTVAAIWNDGFETGRPDARRTHPRRDDTPGGNPR